MFALSAIQIIEKRDSDWWRFRDTRIKKQD